MTDKNSEEDAGIDEGYGEPSVVCGSMVDGQVLAVDPVTGTVGRWSLTMSRESE